MQEWVRTERLELDYELFGVLVSRNRNVVSMHSGNPGFSIARVRFQCLVVERMSFDSIQLEDHEYVPGRHESFDRVIWFKFIDMKDALDKAIERWTQFMGFKYHSLLPDFALDRAWGRLSRHD